jgi:hypothetical protein
MRITVQLNPEASARARSRSSAKRVLDWLNAPLTPVHANTTDPALAAFFEITVDDPAEATRLVERLQKDPAVDGAYIKPDDELPSM